MLNNVVNRYLKKQANRLPPAVMQTVNNLSRKYKDVGLRVGVTDYLFNDGPDYILTFSGNTFPFVSVFKKFRMRWEPSSKAWWVPFKNWRALEAQFDRALDEEVAKGQPKQPLPQYPWSKGKVWLQNTEMEDEAENTGYLFNPADAKSVWVKATYMVEEYASFPPKRLSNEEAMKVWDDLTDRREYVPVRPSSWSEIY